MLAQMKTCLAGLPASQSPLECPADLSRLPLCDILDKLYLIYLLGGVR